MTAPPDALINPNHTFDPADASATYAESWTSTVPDAGAVNVIIRLVVSSAVIPVVLTVYVVPPEGAYSTGDVRNAPELADVAACTIAPCQVVPALKVWNTNRFRALAVVARTGAVPPSHITLPGNVVVQPPVAFWYRYSVNV
jgi:hypothetical protein